MNALIMLEEENECLRRTLSRNKNTASEAMFALRMAVARKYNELDVRQTIDEVITILSKI